MSDDKNNMENKLNLFTIQKYNFQRHKYIIHDYVWYIIFKTLH